MKLGLIQPVPHTLADGAMENAFNENYKIIAREGTEVDSLWLQDGYSEPTYMWTETYNAIEGVKMAYRASKQGYDGVVIGCTQDPGLIEARSIVDIPVTAVTESSVSIASTLGKKFSFICLLPSEGASIEDRIRRYGMNDRLASIRHTELSANEAMGLYEEPDDLVGTFKDIAAKAVRDDKAEVIVAGCTILGSILTQKKVTKLDDVPIIDPVWAGIKMLEVLVDLKSTFGVGVCRKSIYAAAPGWEQDKPIEVEN